MYFSRMSGFCGLNCWQGNSEIAHATADTPLGPFTLADVILPYFAHGPTIHQLDDGTMILFRLGCSTPGNPVPDHPPCNCPWQNGTSPGALPPPNPHASCGSDYISLDSAPNPNGPWTSLGRKNPTAPWATGTTNPGLLVYPNGTALMAYRGNAAAIASFANNEFLGVATASTWKSDYFSIDNKAPIVSHIGEDPYIYQDKRGNYHIVYHDMQGADRGGHAYSRDLVTWYNGPVPCYTGEVHYDDGSSRKFQKRQRPQLLLESGVPLYLYTGVMPGGATGDYTFTLAQEINQN